MTSEIANHYYGNNSNSGDVYQGNFIINSHPEKQPPIYSINTRPPLEIELVGRSQLLQEVIQKLFQFNKVGLWGSPGVGKSALVRALIYHPDILKRYYDGILWANVQNPSDIHLYLDRWLDELQQKDKTASIPSIEEVDYSSKIQSLLTQIIGTKKILIVLDNVDTDLAKALCINSENTGLLVTGRSYDLVQPLTGTTQSGMLLRVPELDTRESLYLLKKQLDADLIEKHFPELNGLGSSSIQQGDLTKLVNNLGGLPLGLIIIGRYLNQEYKAEVDPAIEVTNRIDEIINALKAAKARIELKIKEEGKEISLLAAIDISFSKLTNEAKQLFRALSVFPPKPNTFAETALLEVANCLNSKAALGELLRAALIERVKSIETNIPVTIGQRISVHQTIAEYSHVKATENTEIENLKRVFSDVYLKLIPYNNLSTDYTALDLEEDNILNAIEYAYQQGRNEIIMQSAVEFYPYLESRGRYEQAEKYLIQAQNTAKATENKHLIAEINVKLVRIKNRWKSSKIQNPQELADEGYSAVEYCLTQIDTTTERKEELTKLKMEYARSRARLMALSGKLNEAIEFLKEIEPQAGLAKLPIQQAYILQDIGSILGNLGEFKEVEDYFHRALSIVLQSPQVESLLKDESNLENDFQRIRLFLQKANPVDAFNEILEAISQILQNIGTLMKVVARPDQGVIYLELSLEVAEKIKNKERVISALHMLAQMELDLTHYDKAKTFLDRAIKEAEAIGHIDGIIFSYDVYAQLLSVQEALQKPDEFITWKHYIENAIKVGEQYPQRLNQVKLTEARINRHHGNLELSRNILNVLKENGGSAIPYELALISLQEKEFVEASQYVDQALQQAKEDLDYEILCPSMLLKSQLYHKQGAYDLALQTADDLLTFAIEHHIKIYRAKALLQIAELIREVDQYGFYAKSNSGFGSIFAAPEINKITAQLLMSEAEKQFQSLGYTNK